MPHILDPKRLVPEPCVWCEPGHSSMCQHCHGTGQMRHLVTEGALLQRAELEDTFLDDAPGRPVYRWELPDYDGPEPTADDLFRAYGESDGHS